MISSLRNLVLFGELGRQLPLLSSEEVPSTIKNCRSRRDMAERSRQSKRSVMVSHGTAGKV